MHEYANLDWIMLKNNRVRADVQPIRPLTSLQTTRDDLDYLRQEDSHSCGPLAAGAAITLLQGFRPVVSNLCLRGIEGWTNSSMDVLRDSVLMVFLVEAALLAKQAKEEGWLNPAVEDELQTWCRIVNERQSVPSDAIDYTAGVNAVRWLLFINPRRNR